jgi:hypothetical protein
MLIVDLSLAVRIDLSLAVRLRLSECVTLDGPVPQG